MIGAAAHEAARCREGYACHGPGCRVTTGKTRRKQNWNRPKRNKAEAEPGYQARPKQHKDRESR